MRDAFSKLALIQPYEKSSHWTYIMIVNVDVAVTCDDEVNTEKRCVTNGKC